MKRRILALLAAVALLGAACSDDDTTEAEPAATEAPVATEAPAPTEAMAEMATHVDIDAALAADLDNCVDAPSGDPIRVGMAMDFGEVSGFADIPGSQAVTHLADLINCIGGVGGRPVDVSVQDIQGDPEVTARATQDLLEFGAHFLIGPPFADFGQPVLQVTEGNVPVFFAASTEPSLPDVGANSFLVTFDDTRQATAAAEWALEQGHTRAITFSSPGPYFGYNPEIFTEVFEAGGGEVISDQNYVPIEDVDFSAQVNELAGIAQGDEVLYSAMLAFQVTALRSQLEAQGLAEITYLGTDAFEATGLLFAAPEESEGMVHTTHAFAEPGGRIDLLLQSYAGRHGEQLESGTFAGLYADSMLLGIQGMLDSGSDDPVEIGAAVAAIESFEGFTGAMGYAGTNGIPDKPVSIHRVVGGVDTLVANWE
ncbi:ABC transporter substrate-binding protein [Candidatus Poriferisodalis sp.]|uniref:ABC transporter substrate-binding protein n=1 Tax=Candidatus Poriferisodalis sp. TaxID=3101277 RepID=UPI003B02846E